MSNRLYVGNLAFNTTRESLRAAFSAIGEVTDVSMPTNHQTGRSEGFAFVTMGSSQAATSAIMQLNASTLDGRTINVMDASQAQHGGGGQSHGSSGGRGHY